MDDFSPRGTTRSPARPMSQAHFATAQRDASQSGRRLLGWTLTLTGAIAMVGGAVLIAVSAF